MIETWIEAFIYGTVAVLILGVILLIIDYGFAKRLLPVAGIVYSRHYVPESVHTGVGPATGGNGGIAVTFSSESAKWVLIVRGCFKIIKPIFSMA